MATELFNGFLRLGNFPLDQSSVFQNFTDAYNYAATNETAYLGQVIAVVDSIEEEVSIYTLTFPSDGFEGRYELVGIASGDSAIRLINGKAPDEDGVVTLYGTDIQISESDAKTIAEALSILSSITETETEITFSKTVVVERLTGLNTSLIGQPTDAINLQYLNSSIDNSLIGSTKTVKAILTNTGRAYADEYFDFPVDSVIRKVRVDITQAYSITDITLSIGGLIVVSPSDIFETEIGTYIVETDKVITTTGPLIATLSAASATGAAKVFIDYILNPYDNN